MNNMRFGFSIWGLLIFILPMLINIVYVVLPPANVTQEAETNKILEMVEQVTRILYAAAICILVSNQKINFKSVWFYVGLLFLVLYYIVWIRYFAGGRDVALLGKSFGFVPMPLAVFPVLYYLCAAVWLQNWPAFGCMVVFGIAHNVISYLSLA